jgi:hypothetical protein
VRNVPCGFVGENMQLCTQAKFHLVSSQDSQAVRKNSEYKRTQAKFHLDNIKSKNIVKGRNTEDYAKDKASYQDISWEYMERKTSLGPDYSWHYHRDCCSSCKCLSWREFQCIFCQPNKCLGIQFYNYIQPGT